MTGPTSRYLLFAFIALGAAGAGCDTAAFAASSTIGVVRRASPSIARYRDPDLAEAAIPGSIGTMEGLLELQGHDPYLRTVLARSYSSFGFGFLEEHLEAAEFDGADEDTLEHWRNRASAAYLRARELAIAALDDLVPEGGGLVAARSQGLEEFTRHVGLFDNPQVHAPLLFWAAYSWARWISLHRDDVDALADLPLVNALADRVLALDSTYMDHAPVALRAGLIGSAPQQFGGRPQEAKEQLEQAIALTNRQNLMYMVLEARICAVGLQDRALYQRLLQEVIDFDVDSVPDQRLPNLLAQRRARRYLQEIDNYFEPEGASEDGGDSATDE